jgi:putative ABC transport system substrate-binding protein
MPELARLGFREGKNLVLEERAGELASLPQLARDLVLTKPDAIIAIGPDAIRAASDATSTVPIVTFGADPVERGLAASHARPGGNITGGAIFAEELDGKRLDLLHAAVPYCSPFGVHALPGDCGARVAHGSGECRYRAAPLRGRRAR